MAWPDGDNTQDSVDASASSASAPATVKPVTLQLPALLPIDRAAAVAGISRRTMYYWIAKGLVRTERVASGRLRVVTSSLFKTKEPAA